MHNLRFRWLAILLAFTFFAAACGGETTGDSGDDGGDDAPETTTGDDGGDDAPETTTGDDGGDDAPETTAGDDTGDDAPDDEMPTEEAAGPNIYEDPRGGIFADFQQGFDRGDHPFAQHDVFCVRHDPAQNRVDTDDGITADSIKVGHIRSRLEDLTGLGFAVPVGDPKEIFEVYIDYINSECGGIRGRMLDLGYAEAEVLGSDVDGSRNAACLAMTEDHQSVIVMNSTGFQGTANLCLVEEQETIFISTQGQTEEFMARSNDLLLSLSPTLEESLRFMVVDLLNSGELDGLTLGVAAPNTPGQVEAVEEGLVIPLRDAGFEVVFDVIDCGGGTICFGGVAESVTNMVNAGVNGFFNVLNVVSAPGYIGEMVNQGYEPGDVRFFASDFNSQTSELVSGQIANNVEAGNLYNGATIIDFRTTGEYRDPDYVPNAMADNCNRLYSENSPSGASHDWRTLGDSAYGMVGSVCGIVRIMARGLYDAGDNPTIADVREAIVNLGPVDNNAMSPASLRPGKTQMADSIQTLDFSFPCDQALPFVRRSGDPICITGRNDFRPAPR
ncbi:MAG: ABC transporter substrate-binding protein [Acidimicrobiaceae bacterium]|nr:ABC transporter substrate-binding protein [Acidimicrobiaceae bacterium]